VAVAGTMTGARAGAEAPARRSIARNSTFSLASQMAIRALSVLFSIAVVRRFGSATFGQYSSVLAFVGLFSVLSDLGLGSWGTRAIAQEPARTSELVWRVATLRIALSAATAAVIVGLAALIYPAQHVLAIAVASCALFLFGVSGAFDMAWLGHERLDISSSVSVINQLAFVGIGTAVLVLHGGVLALVIASIVALALATAASWRMARRRLGLTFARPTLRGGWPLVRACAPIGAVQISLLISYKMDTVLLSIFRSNEIVGVYAVAYNLIFSLMLISHSVNLALFPALSRVSDDRAALNDLAARAVKCLTLLCVPVAFGGALLASALIRVLYTDAYRQAATVLQIVIWVLPFMFLTEFYGYYLTAIHRERSAGRAALIMAGMNVVLNLICIPRFGVWAAAIITVITEVVFLAQYLWALRDRGAIGSLARLLWRPVLASSVMALALRVLPLHALPAMIVLGAVIYGGMILLLGGVRRAELAAVLPRWATRMMPAVPVEVTAE
jgi:O-antigen/teichoic acid export membrane protein